MRICLIRYVTHEDMIQKETWLFKWKICTRKMSNAIDTNYFTKFLQNVDVANLLLVVI